MILGDTPPPPPFKKKSRHFVLSRILHKGGIFYKRQRLNVCIKDFPTGRRCTFLFFYFLILLFSFSFIFKRCSRATSEARRETFEARSLLSWENPLFDFYSPVSRSLGWEFRRFLSLGWSVFNTINNETISSVRVSFCSMKMYKRWENYKHGNSSRNCRRQRDIYFSSESHRIAFLAHDVRTFGTFESHRIIFPLLSRFLRPDKGAVSLKDRKVQVREKGTKQCRD